MIRRWNRQAESLFGWRRESIIGASLSDLSGSGSFHVLERPDAVTGKNSGQRWEGEAKLIDAGGAEIDIQANLDPAG